MKFIVAIIKPAKLEEVRSSLSEIDVAGLPYQRSKDLVVKRVKQNSTEELNIKQIFSLRQK